MYLGAQRKPLIETVLLSTHNICFGGEIRKIIFKCTLLSGGLLSLENKKVITFFQFEKMLLSRVIII